MRHARACNEVRSVCSHRACRDTRQPEKIMPTCLREPVSKRLNFFCCHREGFNYATSFSQVHVSTTRSDCLLPTCKHATAAEPVATFASQPFADKPNAVAERETCTVRCTSERVLLSVWDALDAQPTQVFSIFADPVHKNTSRHYASFPAQAFFPFSY